MTRNRHVQVPGQQQVEGGNTIYRNGVAAPGLLIDKRTMGFLNMTLPVF